MTDEIICSECGRPNLPEAEKCWYCQALLKETAQGEDGDEEAKVTDEPGVDEHSPGESEAEMIVEDIPEWLKRVRDLKKADQPEELEEDQWRQQILFDSKAKEKSASKTSRRTKPQPASKPSEDKPESPLGEVGQSLFTQESENLEAGSSLLETDGAGADPADETDAELPDGFTPLDTNKG